VSLSRATLLRRCVLPCDLTTCYVMKLRWTAFKLCLQVKLAPLHVGDVQLRAAHRPGPGAGAGGHRRRPARDAGWVRLLATLSVGGFVHHFLHGAAITGVRARSWCSLSCTRKRLSLTLSLAAFKLFPSLTLCLHLPWQPCGRVCGDRAAGADSQPQRARQRLHRHPPLRTTGGNWVPCCALLNLAAGGSSFKLRWWLGIALV